MTNPIPTAELKAQIGRELYKAVNTLTDDPELLCILGSYGDTLDDTDILGCLKSYNETGLAMQPILRAHPPGKPKLKLVKTDE